MSPEAQVVQAVVSLAELSEQLTSRFLETEKILAKVCEHSLQQHQKLEELTQTVEKFKAQQLKEQLRELQDKNLNDCKALSDELLP